MPCDTITTAKLDLTKADSDILAATLDALGLEVTQRTTDRIVASNYNTDVVWTRAKGLMVETRSRQAEKWADKIQTSYTTRVIETANKRLGWQVKQITSETYQVIRR